MVTAPSAAKVVIVKSTGPSADQFPVGTILQESDGIVLRKHDEVTVLNSEGTIVLKGPVTLETIEKPEIRDRQITLASITRDAQRRRVAAGATRDYEAEFQTALVENRNSRMKSQTLSARVPTIWHVDPSLPGAWCYTDAEELELWRLNAEAGIDLIFSIDGAAPIKLRWPKGENYIYWPYRMGPEDGLRYFVQSPDKFSHYVTLNKIEFVPDMVELAKLLNKKDCFYQLDLIAPEGNNAS